MYRLLVGTFALAEWNIVCGEKIAWDKTHSASIYSYLIDKCVTVLLFLCLTLHFQSMSVTPEFKAEFWFRKLSCLRI